MKKKNRHKNGVSKIGLPPGSLVYTGRHTAEEARITLIDYDRERFTERTLEDIAACREYLEKPSVSWINITGLNDTGMIRNTGAVFGLHPLVLEDVLNARQRPKTEDYGDYLFLVFKMLYADRDTGGITTEQVSLIFGRGYVLSFQERPQDVFDLIRDRLRSAKGRIRTGGADYLAYALLDAVVDNYFLVLERYGDRIDDLHGLILERPVPDTLQKIQFLKKEMIAIRKALWPLRELVSSLEKTDNTLVADTTGPYIRDVYEHTVQVIDTLESIRDTLAGMQDLYLSSVSNRMNEVMKVLTIIATIFIPVTFIAGIYGMNFEYMPELKFPWAYPAALGVMLLVVAVMLLYFKRKHWL